MLFSDLRDFTKISQARSSEQVVSQLNQYLTTMTEIAFDCSGTLDKYIGGGLTAIFGAPVPCHNHAVRACNAAVAMTQSLGELNSRWVSSGYPALDMGIGVSTGTALVRNLGSKHRFDYTAIGESVKLAARLQSLSNYYGERILISEATYMDLNKNFHCFEVDMIRIGENSTAKIYSISTECSPTGPRTEALYVFEKAMQYYKMRDWHRALDTFQRVYNIDSSFRLLEIYIRRCRYLIKNPPPSSWDGVWTLR